MAITGSTGGREGWSSRTAFVLAAIGSAVGLGNLWRFPAEAGNNGGGAFVLFYILCVVLIGLPVLLAETLIGRHGQSSAPESVRRLAKESRASKHWDVLASLGVLSAFLILSFYCVVGGWVFYYVGIFFSDLVQTGITGGAFEGRDPAEIEALLPGLFGNGPLMVGLDLLFLAVTYFFVARGVSGGIEVMAVWLMPAFFFLLIGITIYGAFGGEFTESLTYLFTFEPEKLTGPVMLAALGQAFFSLSLGVAGMITYGGYVGRNVNLAGTSAIISGADTAVALLAGLCLFPIVFAAGLPANAGPGLMFQTLPHAFQSMPGGSLVGILFFIMVSVAALTSSVALLEVPTSWMIEKFKLTRIVSSALVALGALALGSLAALSFNMLADFRPLGFIPLFAETNFFDTLDGVTAKLFMPIAAILTCIFVGWIADQKLIDSENGLSGGLHLFWRFLVRWACPLALAAITIVGIFPDLFA
ncbi:NSS family neurotransmitter:Na+ symporter [Altererythrobacter atlanticus]|uniref:Sodium:neurotransmitter symporter family protein n=1 Tax=Croceibacterium atlanticum TaxID=1267766 RepID=A0A0F7KQR8_9SPHN|nr:sodium-dependent transporter [Croceibacterium atlanticum]AKH41436.1 Sodium:neurotransmitter symporter family protein [Croceibacterium atlanticum]MBB5732898.1 NSS family neurotransmitter:Na+ symporter [Croceibacterium atlanticum]